MDNSDASTFCSRANSFFDDEVTIPRNPILFTETQEPRSPVLLECSQQSRRSSVARKLAEILSDDLVESNKENIEAFKIPKKRGRKPKNASLPKVPKVKKKPGPKPRPKPIPNQHKFLSQPQLPPTTSSGLDYTEFHQKMKSLPTEMELLQVQRKTEIDNLKTVWRHYNAGLKAINKEHGIETTSVVSDFDFFQGPTDSEKRSSKLPENFMEYSQDIFEESSDFNDNFLPILSPPPPSVAPTVKRHLEEFEDIILTDQFMFGIDDLQAIATHFDIDFLKLLRAATDLRENGKISMLSDDDEEDEVIDSSQSPTRSRDFWRLRMSQTQSFFGK